MTKPDTLMMNAEIRMTLVTLMTNIDTLLASKMIH